MGSWLSRWTPSRRRLAVKPIFRRAGRLSQPFAEAEVHGVVDGRFGAQRPALLVVLLDLACSCRSTCRLGVTPSVTTRVAKRARGVVLAATVDAAVEDQADPVGAAQVEVVADDLLEEDPPGHRPCPASGSGKTPPAGSRCRSGSRPRGRGVNGCGSRASHLRSNASICAGPRLSQIACKAATVINGGERVVQRGEADPGLGGLAFGPLVTVDAQLGVEREVAAELQEERAEVLVDAIEVKLVDHPSFGGQSTGRSCRRPGDALRVRNSAVFSCARPMNSTPSVTAEAVQVLVGHVVLALPLGEIHPRDLRGQGRKPAPLWRTPR